MHNAVGFVNVKDVIDKGAFRLTKILKKEFISKYIKNGTPFK